MTGEDSKGSKKFAFPSFKSAPKPEPISQAIAQPRPQFVKEEKPRPPSKRPIRDIRLGVERVREETVFDIDRKGDREIFWYGEPPRGSVPAYHRPKHTMDEVKIRARVDFGRVAETAPIPIIPRPSSPLEKDFHQFSLEDGLEGSPCLDSSYEALVRKRQEPVNEALEGDPANQDLWIRLVAIQDQVWREFTQRPSRSFVIERQLAILDKAQKACSSVRLKIAEIECKTEILPHDQLTDLWRLQLSLHPRSLSLWTAHLAWLKHGTGLGKFSLKTCLDGYEQAMAELGETGDERLFGLFADLCFLLRDADYMEKMVCLLRAFFGINFKRVARHTYALQFTEQSLQYMGIPSRPWSFRMDGAATQLENWLRLEEASQDTYWLPRLDTSTDLDDPAEDYNRQVVWEDLDPFLKTIPVSLEKFSSLLLDLFDLAPSLVISRNKFIVDPFAIGKLDGKLPADKHTFVLGMLVEAVQIDPSNLKLVESLVIVHQSSLDDTERWLKTLLQQDGNVFSLWWAYTLLLKTQGRLQEALQVVTLLSSKITTDLRFDFILEKAMICLQLGWKKEDVSVDIATALGFNLRPEATPIERLRAKQICSQHYSLPAQQKLQLTHIYCSKNIDSLLSFWRSHPHKNDLAEFVLRLYQHSHLQTCPNNHQVPPGYRDILFEMLEGAPLNKHILASAWLANSNNPVLNRFRIWLDLKIPSLDPSAGRKLMKMFISLERQGSGTEKLFSLAKKALETPTCKNDPYFWAILLTHSPDSTLKSLIYQAINACPSSKEIYLKSLSLASKKNILSASESTELYNLMEEKGIRVRRLLEECEL